MLYPVEVKVDNPWIQQQTHQEFLKTVKVSTLHCNLFPLHRIRWWCV